MKKLDRKIIEGTIDRSWWAERREWKGMTCHEDYSNLNFESSYSLFSTWIQTGVLNLRKSCLRNSSVKWGHMKPLQTSSLYGPVKRLWKSGKTCGKGKQCHGKDLESGNIYFQLLVIFKNILYWKNSMPVIGTKSPRNRWVVYTVRTKESHSKERDLS